MGCGSPGVWVAPGADVETETMEALWRVSEHPAVGRVNTHPPWSESCSSSLPSSLPAPRKRRRSHLCSTTFHIAVTRSGQCPSEPPHIFSRLATHPIFPNAPTPTAPPGYSCPLLSTRHLFLAAPGYSTTTDAAALPPPTRTLHQHRLHEYLLQMLDFPVFQRQL